MEYVATLVAAPETHLEASLLTQLTREAEKAGASSVHSMWLTESIAADIFCIVPNAQVLLKALKAKIGDEEIDIIVQPALHRRKKILAADMESTIIDQETLDEIAAEIGARDQVAQITRRAMNGEIDFAAALRARVALLKGKPSSILTAVGKRITVTSGADELLKTMKARGAYCVLVSGGFTFYATPVGDELGFDKSYANTVVVKDGVFTGEVSEPILGRERKKAILEEVCRERNVPLSEALAVGDGANDVPMLQACEEGGGLGVAFIAKKSVREAIPNQINFGDLTTLLYAQGYARDKFL